MLGQCEYSSCSDYRQILVGNAEQRVQLRRAAGWEQPHWAKSGMLTLIDYFLYCPSCEEYSALFKTEEF